MKKFKFGSVCSGIEAASCAWNPLGWEASFFSEIEPFPCELLKHHYPETINLGDMNAYEQWPDTNIDVLVGGTPCQSFSVAGLRKGLDDPRGNLMLTFGAIAAKYRPKWLVWENVTGVLSSDEGRDFGTFLAMLAELGYGFAYRVLDAQFFGVAQRRRRVFVVAYLGDWRPAAAVLFERYSLSGDIAPSREKGERIARNTTESTIGPGQRIDYPAEICGTLSDGAHNGGGLNGQDVYTGRILACDVPVMAIQGSMIGRSDKAGPQGDGINKDVCFTLNTTDRHAVAFNERQQAGTITKECANTLSATDYKGVQCVQVAIPLNTMTMQGRPSDDGRMGSGIGKETDPCPTLTKAHSHAVAHTFKVRGGCEGGGKGYLGQDEAAFTLSTTHDQNLYTQSKVRRLTPKECERLQGFTDDYTLIPYRNKPALLCPDGPRYKALGNSMAVPVMRWIGERIEAVDDIIENQPKEAKA